MPTDWLMRYGFGVVVTYVSNVEYLNVVISLTIEPQISGKNEKENDPVMKSFQMVKDKSGY